MILSISIGITQQMPIIRCEVKKDFSYFNTFSLYLNIFNCYFPQNLLYYGVREIFYTFFFKNASQFLPFIRNFAIFALSRPKRMRHSFQMNSLQRFFSHLSLLICIICVPAAHADNFQRLLRSPSAQLLEYARKYTTRNLPDSALFCYTVVAERYNPKMTYADKLNTYKALLGRWSINFSYLGNYREAAEDLAAADRLQQENNLPDTRLLYARGLSDMAIGAQDEDSTRIAKGGEYLKKAYWKALDEKDEETRFMAVYNAATLLDISKDINTLRKEIESVRKHPFADPNLNTFVSLNYEGSMANARNDYKGMLDAYKRQASLDLPQLKYSSLLITGRTKLAQILIFLKRFAEADSVLNKALSFTSLTPSQRLSIIWLKHLTAQNSGHRERSLQLYSDYLELKDSLQTYNMTVTLDQMRFTEQLRRINAEKEQLRQQKRAQTMMLLIAVLVIIGGAVIIWLVVRTNTRLRSARDVMYRRVHELNQYQQALASTETAEPPAQPEDISQKTRNQIPEETQQKIGAEILRVIASDEIFSPDFSLERLAELSGCRPRIASQVINSRFQCNFWSLVNEARIREACRRIDDTESYDSYSTEAIAESVGFNSRSSFCAAFKKFTGLGVGEYRRISRKRTQTQLVDS